MEESRRADSMIARRIPTLPNRVEMDVLFGSYNEKNTKAVLKAAKASPDGYPRLFETRLSYILKTGGNWASGDCGSSNEVRMKCR